jgi:hypothetical protein
MSFPSTALICTILKPIKILFFILVHLSTNRKDTHYTVTSQITVFLNYTVPVQIKDNHSLFLYIEYYISYIPQRISNIQYPESTQIRIFLISKEPKLSITLYTHLHK